MKEVLYILGEEGLMRSVSNNEGGWQKTGETEVPGRAMAAADGTPALGGAVLYAVSTSEGGLLLTIGERVGSPVLLGAVPTAGATPCSVALMPSTRHLAVANYRNGTVGIHRIDAKGVAGSAVDTIAYTGSGPDTRRQDGPHVHCVTSLAPERLLTADLGTDTVRIHEWDFGAETLRDPVEGLTSPGTGPRHAVTLTGDWIVTADELGASVSLLRLDPVTGRITLRDRHRLPTADERTEGRDYPSDVVVDQGHIYVATRGSDVITQLAVEDDRLVAVDEVPSGRWPMRLEIVGTQLLCAARDDDEIRSWGIDPGSGRLTGGKVVAEYPRPVWLTSLLTQ